MTNFNEISPRDFTGNLFKMLSTDWMLICAEAKGHINAMTASCGSFGNIYPYGDVALIGIHATRYTKKLIDASETFSLAFFSPAYHEILKYFGTVSGAHEDKIKYAKLTINHLGETPYFEEASTLFICKKVSLLTTPYGLAIADDTASSTPHQSEYTTYIGQIQKLLIKK